MKIDGSKLLIYTQDGQPIEVSTKHSLDLSEERLPVTELTEYEGTFDFGSLKPYEPFDNPEYCRAWVWRNIQSMPRKKKKRIKRLLKMGYTMNVTIV